MKVYELSWAYLAVCEYVNRIEKLRNVQKRSETVNHFFSVPIWWIFGAGLFDFQFIFIFYCRLIINYSRDSVIWTFLFHTFRRGRVGIGIVNRVSMIWVSRFFNDGPRPQKNSPPNTNFSFNPFGSLISWVCKQHIKEFCFNTDILRNFTRITLT